METIYTIPVNEAFDMALQSEKAQCPFCLMMQKLDESEMEKILGASMMEPDVRIATNEHGFCSTHFLRMLKKKNRLGLALMLESHLAEVEKKVNPKGLAAVIPGQKDSSSQKKLETLEKDCYLCRNIDREFLHMLDTTSFLYEHDPSFKKKLLNQTYYCLPHYRKILESAKDSMNKKVYLDFYSQLSKIETEVVENMKKDVSWFCKKFDYRFDKEPWYNSKDAIERTVDLLCGKVTEDKG